MNIDNITLKFIEGKIKKKRKRGKISHQEVNLSIRGQRDQDVGGKSRIKRTKGGLREGG